MGSKATQVAREIAAAEHLDISEIGDDVTDPDGEIEDPDVEDELNALKAKYARLVAWLADQGFRDFPDEFLVDMEEV